MAAARLDGIDLLPLLPQLRGREHRHAWHEVVYVIGGRYAVQAAGALHVGGPGVSFCYPARFAHRPLPQRAGGRLAVLRWQGPAPAQPLRAEDASGRLLQALLWMWHLSRARPAVPQAVLDGLLAAILHERANGNARDGSLVGRACGYLAADLAYDLPLAELAEAVGVSPATLQRAFVAELGESPMRYRRRLRVERALALLRAGGRDLAAIAEEVGYASPFHLSRLISSATGRSPSAWRRPR